MDIERIKRWHWAAIGLVVGLAFAGTRLFYAHDYAGKSLDQNFNAVAFGSRQQPVLVGFFFGPKRWLYASGVTIHPAMAPDPRVDGPKATGVQWVTGTLHEMQFGKGRDASGRMVFEEKSASAFFHRSTIPYPANGKTYADVRAYLDEVARQSGGKSAAYRVAWWERPQVAWTLWPAAGVLLIGGVWPTVLSLLVGAGLGRRREDGPGVDLSKYKSTATAPTPGGKAGLSDDERRQLDAVAAAMEAELGEGATAGVGGDTGPRTEGPVRELETAPLVAPASEPPRAAKTYDGAFYPTEIHRPGERQQDDNGR